MEETKETKALSSLTVDMGENEYVLSGGSGGPLPPGSVGTEQIIDDSVLMEDLNHEVKDKMLTDEDRVTQEDLDSFEV